MSAPRAPARGTAIALAFVLASSCAIFGLACKVQNEDHCLHKDADADGWCNDQDPALPFCSPCVAANHGCVATEPTEQECPEYSASGTDSGGETETGSESGT